MNRVSKEKSREILGLDAKVTYLSLVFLRAGSWARSRCRSIWKKMLYTFKLRLGLVVRNTGGCSRIVGAMVRKRRFSVCSSPFCEHHAGQSSSENRLPWRNNSNEQLKSSDKQICREHYCNWFSRNFSPICVSSIPRREQSLAKCRQFTYSSFLFISMTSECDIDHVKKYRG